MDNIITKSKNGNHLLNIAKIEFPTYSEQMAGGKDYTDIRSAIKAVIEKEGPGGNHKWEIKIPPLPARNILGGDIYVPEWQVIKGLELLKTTYEDYAAANREDNDFDALRYGCDNDDFNYLDTRRWERIDDQTMAFEFQFSEYYLASFTPDDHYTDYNITHYNGMFEKYSEWFICLLLRAALRNQINPAIGAAASEVYNWDEWPVEFLTDNTKAILKNHPELQGWIKGTEYEELIEEAA